MNSKRAKRGAKRRARGPTVSGQFDCYDRGGRLVKTVTLKPRSTRGVNDAASKNQGTFARWTDRARRVVALANEESARLGNDFVGTEHILLGLLKEGTGVAAHVLRNLGACGCKVEAEIRRLLQEPQTTLVAHTQARAVKRAMR
jgi:hypothetical protein